MIELYTGVPGSGKTLSMIDRLYKFVQRWEKHPEEARPIFVHNIPDLKLPHLPMPLKDDVSPNPKNKAVGNLGVPDWDLMPDGSLVIIDEAQGCFPARSTTSASPYHVAWLNTHRHRGFDIWLTTQHPKLIDGAARALVGRHQHLRRLFGGSRAACYEWDSCSDSLSGLQNAVTSYFPYPKDVFKYYKSAEIHTKQKFRLPKWLLVFPLGIIMAIFTLPSAFNVLSNGMSGKGIKTDSDESVLTSSAPGEVKQPEFTSYFQKGIQCYAVSKTGDFVLEPKDCRFHL